MSVPTGSYQTYQTVGIKEDLQDKIFMISPYSTIFLKMIAKGKAAQTKHEWQTDVLASANADNKVIEGDDVTADSATATTRLYNYTQLMDKKIIVTDTNMAVESAGRKSELALQLSKRGKEIKTDMEKRMLGNYASAIGAAGTARELGGVESWLATNTDREAGGTDPTGDGTNAAGNGSQRAFTEAMLKDVIALCWDSGGEPTMILVGSYNKQKASGFGGIATLYRDTASSMKPASIMGAADIYVSDFGQFKIVASRFSRTRSALVLDMSMWSMQTLQRLKHIPLARTGHGEKRLMKVEFTLCSKNEAASGVIADLTTT